MAARLVKKEQQIMLFTHQGMAVRFDQAKVRPMGRMARGVRGVMLKDKEDYLVGCEVVNGTESILVVCENGFGKRSHVEGFRQTNRGGVGVRSIITSDRNGNVIGALCVSDQDGMVMMSKSGQTVRITMKDLRVMGRNTQGVKLVNLREDDGLIGIQKIESTDDVQEKINEVVDSPVNPTDVLKPIEDFYSDEEPLSEIEEEVYEEDILDEEVVVADEPEEEEEQ